MSTPIIRPGIEELRERIRRLEGAADRRRLVLPFGIQAIDRHLPGGGLALGALHEVVGGGHAALNLRPRARSTPTPPPAQRRCRVQMIRAMGYSSMSVYVLALLSPLQRT